MNLVIVLLKWVYIHSQAAKATSHKTTFAIARIPISISSLHCTAAWEKIRSNRRNKSSRLKRNILSIENMRDAEKHRSQPSTRRKGKEYIVECGASIPAAGIRTLQRGPLSLIHCAHGQLQPTAVGGCARISFTRIHSQKEISLFPLLPRDILAMNFSLFSILVASYFLNPLDSQLAPMHSALLEHSLDTPLSARPYFTNVHCQHLAPVADVSQVTRKWSKTRECVLERVQR